MNENYAKTFGPSKIKIAEWILSSSAIALFACNVNAKDTVTVEAAQNNPTVICGTSTHAQNVKAVKDPKIHYVATSKKGHDALLNEVKKGNAVILCSNFTDCFKDVGTAIGSAMCSPETGNCYDPSGCTGPDC